MKFSHDDLRNIDSLRISIHSSASPQAFELAGQFNEELAAIQNRLDEFFIVPDFDPLESDLKALEKIGKDRRFLRFDLIKDILRLLSTRVDIDARIQGHLNQASSDAGTHLKTLHAEYSRRLSESGVSGPALTAAVGSVDKVREAHDAWQQQRGFVGTLSNEGNGNASSGTVARIRGALFERFRSWVAELADIEEKPEDPQRPPKQPDWKAHTVVIPGTPATRN